MKLYLTVFTALALVGVSGSALAESDKKGHHHGKERMEKMLKKVDTNQDGVISRAEHDAFSDKRFKKMDADGDGNVTAEERKARHDAMKERRKSKKDAAGEAAQ